MKVKISLIVILATTLAVAGAAYILWPQYNNRQVAKKYIEKGFSQLEAGKVTQGLANVTHAINHVGSVGNLPDGLGDQLDDALLGIAGQYPMKSHILLDFLDSHSIEIPCAHRLNMYNHLLRKSVENYKGNKSLSDLEQALFLAALWGGQCNVEKNQVTKFKKIFDFYKKKKGEYFEKSPWMGLAYGGKPIVGSPDVPGMKERAGGVDSAVATGETGADTAGGHESEAFRAEAVEQSLEPAPRNQKQASAAAEKPAARHLSEDLMKKSAPAAAAAETPAKPTGFIGMVKSKVSGLIGQDKQQDKPAPAARQQKPAQNISDEDIKNVIENAEGVIRDLLKVYDISLLEMNFTEDGSVLHVTFESENVNSKILVTELKNLLNAIHESKQQNPRLPLKYLVIQLKDVAGELKAIWDIEYQDFVDYKSGKLTGDEFRKKWKEQIF